MQFKDNRPISIELGTPMLRFIFWLKGKYQNLFARIIIAEIMSDQDIGELFIGFIP